jgi:uncharacterized protein YndB with AHSA1/START domain
VPPHFRLDHTVRLDESPADLWPVLTDPERFGQWWTWLRSIETEGVVAGTITRCVVRGPLPWSWRFAIRIDEVVPERTISGYATGDVDGPARLDLEPDGTGTLARLRWDLVPHHAVLAGLGQFGRPLLEWGQRWIVSTGMRQFSARDTSTP